MRRAFLKGKTAFASKIAIKSDKSHTGQFLKNPKQRRGWRVRRNKDWKLRIMVVEKTML